MGTAEDVYSNAWETLRSLIEHAQNVDGIESPGIRMEIIASGVEYVATIMPKEAAQH